TFQHATFYWSSVPKGAFGYEKLKVFLNVACPDKTDAETAEGADHAGTSVEPTVTSNSPQKRTLRRKVKQLSNRLYRLRKKSKQEKAKTATNQPKKDAVIDSLAHFLPQECVTFISSQLREIEKKKRGRIWTETDKTTALSLFHTSPKAYRILGKIFILPSVSLLRKTMQKVAVHAGFSEKILKGLAVKINAMSSPHAGLCAVVMDEMTIKEQVSYNRERDEIEGLEDFGGGGRTEHVANHATVFLVRGLISHWKQPIGYFLSSGPIDSKRLHSLLLECIDKVQAAGMEVKVVIADQGTNNRKMFEKFCGITDDDPFFFHHERKVHVLYDPPHLLKTVRNNFKRTGFSINGTDINWQYVETFYHFDKENAVRLAPKLTDTHLNLPPFSPMSVKLAAQVLSHSVAAGVSTLVQLKVLPTDAKGGHLDNPNAAQFRLFLRQAMVDSLFIHSAGSNCSEDNDKFLLNLTSVTSDSQTDCDTEDDLWPAPVAEGRREDGVSDGNVEQAECDRDPGPALEAEDPGPMLDPAEEPGIPQHDVVDRDTDLDTDLLTLALPCPLQTTAKDPLLEKAEKNALTYVTGYLVKKISDKVCEQCKASLTGSLTGSESEILLTNKQYEGLEQGLSIPSELVRKSVEALETVYSQNIERVLPTPKVKAQLLGLLQNEIGSDLACPAGTCDMKENVIRLFINVRLNHSLKVINLSFSNKSLKRNKKLMKLSHV
ncbi:hypothetical protein BaRGS_00037614, partial [Batillaria attramentaria]